MIQHSRILTLADRPQIVGEAGWVGEQHSSVNIPFYYPNVPIIKGDLMVMHTACRTSSNFMQTPGGWVQIYSDFDNGNFWSQKIVYKICDGTETPGAMSSAVTVGSVTTAIKFTRNLLIRGANVSATPWEGGVINALAGAQPLVSPNTTSTLYGNLAMCFYSSPSIMEYSVMSGWQRPYTYLGMVGIISTPQSFSGNFQFAYMNAPGSISGGPMNPGAALNMSRTILIKPLKL